MSSVHDLTASSRAGRPSSLGMGMTRAWFARLGPLAALLLSAAVGISLASHVVLAFIPIGLLVAALLLVDGRARLAFVVFGGPLVLQRSEGLAMSKLALLAGFVVAFAGAFFNVRKRRRTAAYNLARPLLAASTTFAALAVLALVLAYARGTPLVDSVRDITPYLLFASAPIFALDAQAVLGRKALVRVLVALGTFGAVSFAVAWLERRGIANLPLARVGVQSLFIPAALFSYAMSIVLQTNARRPRWLLLAAILLALLIATGTRATLTLIVAPLAILVASRRQLARRSFRLALLAPVAVAMTIGFALAVVEFTHADISYLQNRLTLLRSSGQSASDASFNDRLEQGRVAWAAFKSSPAFGVGPGYLFEWTPQGELPQSGFVLDTPLTFPAKFGILGLAVLVFVLTRFWSFARSLVRGWGPDVPYLAVVGYLGVVMALSLFAPPFEDKGFAFGLIVLSAVALASVGGPSGSSIQNSTLEQ
jgi:O-antigen ligase